MNSTVASIYLDGTYASRNDSFGDTDAAWKAKNIVKMIERQKLAPATVWEVGCGGGGILLQLREMLPPATGFTGFEPMPEAFKVCEARTGERLQFHHRSPAGEQPAEPADVLLLIDVMEHVEDCIGFLRSLRGLGRTFLFHIPLDMSVQCLLRLKPILRVRHEVGHLHYFCKDTALATLQDAGYRVTDWFYTDHYASPVKGFGFHLLRLPRKLAGMIHRDLAVRVLGGASLMVAATAEPG